MRVALVAATIATAAAARTPNANDGRRISASVLFWSQAERDANFRAMERLVPGHHVRTSGSSAPLLAGPSIEAKLGGAPAIDRWIDKLNIAGLLVLKDGRIRLEQYARGFSADQRWTSFSVAKSITSTLVGAAIRDGSIKSVEDPITRYIPEFAGSSYDGVTIRQVLTMTSGVAWNEDYTDPNSDVVRLFAETPPTGSDPTIAYLGGLPRAFPPGTQWTYNTGETSLIGVLVHRATGATLANYLSRTIWRPAGMERDAFWQIDANGQEPGGCCFSATLRDYGRFGRFMLDGGIAGGRRVLPEGWLSSATAVQHPFGKGAGYGYQWWTNIDGSYRAIGIFGQTIHIDPVHRLVIVMVSAWPKATDEALSRTRNELIAAIAHAVDEG